MITVKVDIDQEMLERVRKMPDMMVPSIYRGLKKGMLRAEARAKDLYLSGYALFPRTGHLRRSPTSDAMIDGDTVSGVLGTNVIYGRFWELGFSGIEQVKAHVRKIKARDIWGRERRVSARTGKAYSAKVRQASGVSFVKAHARQVNVKPRPFLRPAILDMLDFIAEDVGKEIKTALEG